MSTTIKLDEFMKNASIVHSDMATNYNNALEFFILQRETKKKDRYGYI
jgi:hypothetical protein